MGDSARPPGADEDDGACAAPLDGTIEGTCAGGVVGLVDGCIAMIWDTPGEGRLTTMGVGVSDEVTPGGRTLASQPLSRWPSKSTYLRREKRTRCSSTSKCH